MPQARKILVAEPTTKTNKSTPTTLTETDKDKALPTEMKDLMKKIKDAGTAGIVSFGLVQLGFWSISLIIVLFGYVKVTGHLPDLSDQEEVNKLGAGTSG